MRCGIKFYSSKETLIIFSSKQTAEILCVRIGAIDLILLIRLSNKHYALEHLPTKLLIKTQDFNLASHTTHVVCVYFIHDWRNFTVKGQIRITDFRNFLFQYYLV